MVCPPIAALSVSKPHSLPANPMSTSHYSKPYQGPQPTPPPNKPRHSVAYAIGLGVLLIADLIAIQFCDCLGESLVLAGLAVFNIAFVNCRT